MLRREPELRNAARQHQVKARRKAALQAEHSAKSNRPTELNDDEVEFAAEGYPVSFTKGLPHEENGTVSRGYPEFTEAINRDSPANSGQRAFKDVPRFTGGFNGGTGISWRGWESPRTGHYFDLQGPDADAFGMAPPPEYGSEELTAEMAEVYAMALLRDVPFKEIESETGKDGQTGITVKKVLAELNKIGYFSGSTAGSSASSDRRLAARFFDPTTYDVNTGGNTAEFPKLTGKNLFRGSSPGAQDGPWVSQFMVAGNVMRPKPGKGGKGKISESYIRFGSQVIDQKGLTLKPCLDYMTNWEEWLDVQNGADLRSFTTEQNLELSIDDRKFLDTPRDIAAYVRVDALYQAYLNACLLLLGQLNPVERPGFQLQDGFPDTIRRKDPPADNDEAMRTGFAAFGGPHILSLVTEVATRCLKFARRQKFNWHRRARPEKISGLLTLAAINGQGDAPELGEKTFAEAQSMIADLGGLADLIHDHNQSREASNAGQRGFAGTQPPWLSGSASGSNLLLAMAFAEGSPMHPAYAAGHATVAGGCVTILKAFFKTIENGEPVKWSVTGLDTVQSTSDGKQLERIDADLTIEGELNKLAANISIARNMAGVHYYSDYYDSLRMGERVAVGILLEQMTSYEEPVSMIFRSFDGDMIKIRTDNTNAAEVNGSYANYLDWVHRPQSDPHALIASAAPAMVTGA